MEHPSEVVLREQLLDRRRQLTDVVVDTATRSEVMELLERIDSALARMDRGTYGLCGSCHDPIETETLAANPLAAFCLECLSPAERQAFQKDLEIASEIQTRLLPQRNLVFGGWEVSYTYEPLGVVSGDFCDLIPSPDGSLYFLFGDVAGKGVSASLMATHLHALFRTMIEVSLPLQDLLDRANRLFCESTLPSFYVTLVAGCLCAEGHVEMVNAGHLPVFMSGREGLRSFDSNSLPFGLFLETHFSVRTFELNQGEMLLLHTDGLSESRSPQGEEYGLERVESSLKRGWALSASELVRNSISDWSAFTRGNSRTDDLSVMAIRRE